jgi:hypothetical protein
VRALDAAGNVDGTPATTTWTVLLPTLPGIGGGDTATGPVVTDPPAPTTPPATTTPSTPAPSTPAKGNNKPPKLNVKVTGGNAGTQVTTLAATATDDGAVKTVAYLVDGKVASTTTKASSTYRVGRLSNSVHTLTVRAIDDAGLATSWAMLVRPSGRSAKAAAKTASVRGRSAPNGADATSLTLAGAARGKIKVTLTTCVAGRPLTTITRTVRLDKSGKATLAIGRGGLCITHLDES